MSFLARRAFAATQRAITTPLATPLAATTATTATTTRAFSASARREIAKITLVGNLAASPELKTTGTGRELVEYTVASNEGSGENRRTSWFRVSAFVDGEARRDFITSLPKGSTVYVEGDCALNSYTDGEGKQRTALNIRQKNLQVLRKPQPTPSESES